MKIKIILSILTFALISNVFAQNKKKTSWDSDGLKDKVKITKTITYNAVDTLGKISKKQIVDDVYGYVLIWYNISGKWIEYRSFNPDGSKRWSELPLFNERGEYV